MLHIYSTSWYNTLIKPTRIGTDFATIDVDDMLKKCLPKVDKYVIDKQLQHTNDFVYCVAPNACKFALEKIG